MAAIAEEQRLMPHLHLSLQSGDDMILKRMKRRHLRADSIRFCDERPAGCAPTSVFGADLIAGFPTETEAMFENSLASSRSAGSRIFTSSRSRRAPGRRRRACRSCRAGSSRSAPRACARSGDRRSAASRGAGRQRASVLVERDGLGRTEDFTLAALDGEARRARSSRRRSPAMTASSCSPHPSLALRPERTGEMALGFIRKVFAVSAPGRVIEAAGRRDGAAPRRSSWACAWRR